VVASGNKATSSWEGRMDNHFQQIQDRLDKEFGELKLSMEKLQDSVVSMRPAKRVKVEHIDLFGF
jgi:hypothetical protein